ncbi:MAG: trypsin-like peptidase domain-containing protein [Pseudonocardiales bacterium]
MLPTGEEQFRRFVVRIDAPDSCGTGVLVAPGWVLTCAHVVKGADAVRVLLDREAGATADAVPPWVQARVRARSEAWEVSSASAFWPFPELALLELDGWTQHVCAPLTRNKPVRPCEPHTWGFGSREQGVASPGSAAWKRFGQTWHGPRWTVPGIAEVDLSANRYARSLDVLLEAYDFALSGRVWRPGGWPPLDRALDHETRHWRSRMSGVDSRLLERCVALATLAGARDNTEAQALFGLVPALAGESATAVRGRLDHWLRGLYEGPDRQHDRPAARERNQFPQTASRLLSLPRSGIGCAHSDHWEEVGDCCELWPRAESDWETGSYRQARASAGEPGVVVAYGYAGRAAGP